MSPHFLECLKVRDRLEQHEFGYFFRWPVNPYTQGLVDYWKVVRRPMDLTTIGHKLRHGLYSKPAEFDADVLLMLNNALRYNKGNAEVISRIRSFASFYQGEYQKLLHLFRTNLLNINTKKQITVRRPQEKPKGRRRLTYPERMQNLRESFFTEERLR